MSNPFEDLPKTPANFVPLTPLHFLQRAAETFPDRASVVHGAQRFTWAQTYARCRRLASALRARGIGRGDTVSALCPNTPPLYEAHYGVPMAGAVLNAINTRLDAETIGFILSHGEAKVIIVDAESADLARRAIQISGRNLLVIDAEDPAVPDAERIGAVTYEAFLAGGDPGAAWDWPADEWQAISLNYTSGTTGNPKGVVYHHRGAYLNGLGNIVTWALPHHPVYLWTLPMFHCNGWCFPWTTAAMAGTSVCLRKVAAKAMYDAIADEGVTHMCGAPIVIGMLINASDDDRRELPHTVQFMTAASPPPAKVLAAIEEIGFQVTHTYGLTEVYGPATVCAWHSEWDTLDVQERAAKKARQGVRYVVQEGLAVADPETLQPVPADGETMGEVLFRGNITMKGYLKNPSATEQAFAGGWFHTGDLGVVHPDGYIQLRDRSKDIIISGGENISSIEVESALYQHPDVLEVAVVARPDETWGETPCAFVTLRAAAAVSETDLIAFCRARLAHFKCPKTVVFTELPKTSTGKVQKHVLRSRLQELLAEAGQG